MSPWRPRSTARFKSLCFSGNRCLLGRFYLSRRISDSQVGGTCSGQKRKRCSPRADPEKLVPISPLAAVGIIFALVRCSHAQTFDRQHLHRAGRERRPRRALGRCHGSGKCNCGGRTRTRARVDRNSHTPPAAQPPTFGTQDASQHSSETLKSRLFSH
jgi:hypothetical protein